MKKLKTQNNFKIFMLKIIELYSKEAASRENNPYKIIEITEETSQVLFQITGTDIVLKVSSENLMRSEFLLGFSKANIALITHLGTKKELKRN